MSCLLGAGFTFQFRHWFRIVLVFLGSYVPQAGFQVLQGQSFNFERELPKQLLTSPEPFRYCVSQCGFGADRLSSCTWSTGPGPRKDHRHKFCEDFKEKA